MNRLTKCAKHKKFFISKDQIFLKGFDNRAEVILNESIKAIQNKRFRNNFFFSVSEVEAVERMPGFK